MGDDMPPLGTALPVYIPADAAKRMQKQPQPGGILY